MFHSWVHAEWIKEGGCKRKDVGEITVVGTENKEERGRTNLLTFTTSTGKWGGRWEVAAGKQESYFSCCGRLSVGAKAGHFWPAIVGQGSSEQTGWVGPPGS